MLIYVGFEKAQYLSYSWQKRCARTGWGCQGGVAAGESQGPAECRDHHHPYERGSGAKGQRFAGVHFG